MQQFKGSETPWRKTFSIIGIKRAVRCNGYLIATLNPPTRFSGQDERYEKELAKYEADHNLINAAPDLLMALQIMTELFKRVDPLYEPDKKVIEIAENAINKALNFNQ